MTKQSEMPDLTRACLSGEELKAGGFYVRRDGLIVGPLCVQNSTQYPWFIEGSGSYDSRGRFNGRFDDKRDLISVEALSTRTRGMTEERRQLLLDVESAKRAFSGKMIGTLLERIHAVLSVTSEVSGGNGAEELTPEQMRCGHALYGPPARCTCGTCAPLPPPSSGEVTEAEVEAALQGFDTGVGDPNDYRKRMRSALLAARKVRK